MFLATTRAMFHKDETKERLKCFADHANSFEQWLNWELMFAFRQKCAWPTYSAHRERPLPQGGYADLAIYERDEPESTALIETKIIWSNANCSKQIASAVADQTRIRENGSGVGLLLIVAIAAQRRAERAALRVGNPNALLREFEKNAGRNIRSRETLHELKAPDEQGWYIQPHVIVAAYKVR